MHAALNQFTQQMRDRLETTAIGLGLVRLLQDAKRIEEARTTLNSLKAFSMALKRENQSRNLAK
jgi:hypothetical protein